MDYEKVLGEHKFPTYEELKTGLIRLIDEGKISREDAARLLPELRESEDERIRKAVVSLVYEMKGTYQSFAKVELDQMVAWLEKQKEQKPTEEIKDQRQIYFMIEDGRRCGVIEGRKQVIDNPEKYGLQKPAEWSEEDEDMLNSCISSIEEAKENRYAYKETDGDTSYDHEIAWLKSLRPSWKPSEEHLSALLAVFNDPNNIGSQTCQLALTDLYEQLKKL